MIKFTEKFPRSIEIGGKNYAINTDYRIMADLETKISRIDTSDKKAFMNILTETVSVLFKEKPTEGTQEEILDGVMWYYRCGKEPSGSVSGGNGKRCYDYDEDSDYIFAAFRQVYGDDLVSSDMHWWEFRAKFMALTQETKFVNIMQYRCTNISRIKNKEERARIKKLQDQFALKSQKQRKFANAESRDKAIRQKLQRRFDEVKKRAGENK